MAKDLLDWNLNHLICNGVCILKNITKLDGFSYETRYYHIVDYKKYGDVIEIITVQVQLKSDWNTSTSSKNHGNKLPLILAPQTTTFTNIEAVKKSTKIKKKRKEELLAGEKFILTDSFMIPATKGGSEKSSIKSGEFVRCSIKRGNNRVAAYQVDHNKLSRTDGFRADVLFKYHNALNHVYDGAVKLDFKRYNFDIIYKTSELNKLKEYEYKEIISILQKKTIRIINKSVQEINDDIKTLINKILMGNNVIYGGDISPKDLVLIFTDTAEEYKKAGKHDAYQEFKANNPHVISQAITMSSITEKVKSIRKLNFSKDNKVKIDAIKSDEINLINKSSFQIDDSLKKSISKKIKEKKIICDDVIDKNNAILILINEYDKEHKNYEEHIFKEYSHIDNKNIIIATIKKAIKGESILEFSLVELSRKSEILQGEFSSDKPRLPEYAWFIEPIRIKNGKPLTENAENEFSDEENEEIDATDDFVYYKGVYMEDVSTEKTPKIKQKFSIVKLTEEEIEQVKQSMGSNADLVFGRVKKNDKLTKNRNPMIYYPKTKDYIIFTETGRSVIPDYDRNEKTRQELEKGRQEKVGRQFFIDYVNDLFSQEKSKKAIKKMLEDNPSANAFDYKAVIKALTGYVGDNRDEIQILIENQLGIKWLGTSQKATGEHSGEHLVNHQYSFNFSYKHKVYYGGAIASHDNSEQKNFCTLYELTTNMKELPENMHEWFLSFSIRNKQTTIKPYFFKYIREHAAMEYWKKQDKIEAPEIENKEEFDPVAEFDDILL
jgi:hypothetical protein